MNVVKFQKKNRTSLEYRYVACFYLSPHCQEMSYLLLKHLGIYDCENNVLDDSAQHIYCASSHDAFHNDQKK